MALTIGNNGAPLAARLPAAPQGAPQPAAPAAAAVPEPAVRQQPQPDQVRQAVESLRQLVEAKAPNRLAFSVDEGTGRTVVTISDAETGETIRQIPSEKMLEIARALDKMQGMLLQQKA